MYLATAARLRFGVTQVSRFASRKQMAKPQVPGKIVKRRGGDMAFSYRCPPPTDPFVELLIDTTMTFVWAYMFWNYYHSGGVLLNLGVDYHDYTHFTDEELGITED